MAHKLEDGTLTGFVEVKYVPPNQKQEDSLLNKKSLYPDEKPVLDEILAHYGETHFYGEPTSTEGSPAGAAEAD